MKVAKFTITPEALADIMGFGQRGVEILSIKADTDNDFVEFEIQGEDIPEGRVKLTYHQLGKVPKIDKL